MLVWGGYDGSSYLNSGARYTPGTDSWNATSLSNAPTGRAGHTAVWTGSIVVVWGGGDASSSGLTSGGRYNPASDAWIGATSMSNAPSARSGHTAEWTGRMEGRRG
jgi:hypothetical protein